MNPAWLVPEWPAPAHVHALFTSRVGGTSLPPFDSLNLGWHVGDRPAAVAANHALLRQATGVQAVFLSQVHGTQVALVSSATPPAPRADACVTHQTGLACCVLIADCLPLLLTNRQGSLVAAVHAGWRGLAGQGGYGILESALPHFNVLSDPEGRDARSDVLAWLGPCIGPQAFEVGGDVRDAFVIHDQGAAALFAAQTTGKWLADLPGLARRRLRALGVDNIYGNDGGASWCTVENASRYFSYRRDRISGRMAACIWLS